MTSLAECIAPRASFDGSFGCAFDIGKLSKSFQSHLKIYYIDVLTNGANSNMHMVAVI